MRSACAPGFRRHCTGVDPHGDGLLVARRVRRRAGEGHERARGRRAVRRRVEGDGRRGLIIQGEQVGCEDRAVGAPRPDAMS